MIKILILVFVLIGIWFAFEVRKWWKETEDNIRIWPKDIKGNRNE